MKSDTICVHTPKIHDNNTGAVSMPIYQSATYVHPVVGGSTGYDYTRVQNPTRQAVEELVKNLEYGDDALAFSSGMAATSLLMEIFNPGDHIIATEDLYGGSIRLFNSISKKNGVTVEYVDTSNLDMLRDKIKKTTKAIFIETPSNPLMKVSDIVEISKIIRGRDILLIVDNTFLTPYLQNPLNLGADVVIHSATKYLGGHNDTLGGFLVTKDKSLGEKLRYLYKTVGSCLSPFDSFLILRGIKTLAVRMEKSQSNAMQIAQWLLKQKNILKVYYPGLKDHDGYSILSKQSKGFGSMISFHVSSAEVAKHILNNLKIIMYAESLGGVESLITYPILQTHADIPVDIREKRGINDRLLRLSVGIENCEDLINDLSSVLL